MKRGWRIVGVGAALILGVGALCVWWLMAYVPRGGAGSAMFEALPGLEDTRWAASHIALPAVPDDGEVISAGNVAQLAESARWGEGLAQSIYYSPDASLIAVMTALGVDFYDAETLTFVRHIPVAYAVRRGAFSSDGQMLALVRDDHVIELRNVVDGALVRTFQTDEHDYIQQLAFDVAGTQMASASWDNSIVIWSVADGSVARTLRGHEDDVNSVAFHPGGEYVASASNDGTVRVWSVVDSQVTWSTGKPFLLSLKRELGLINNELYFRSVAFSPDGEQLAAQDSQGYVYVWTFPQGRLVQALEGENTREPLAFASNESLVTAKGEHWELRSDRLAHRLEIERGEFEAEWVAPSPNGERLAVLREDKTLGLWSLKDGSFIRGLQLDGALTLPYYMVRFAEDGRTFVVADRAGMVQVRQLPDGRLLQRFAHEGYEIAALEVSADGAYVVTSAEPQVTPNHEANMVFIWRVTDGTLLETFQAHQANSAIAISSDGTTLATAGTDDFRSYSIRLWGIPDGNALGELRSEADYTPALSFAEEGEQLVSASHDDILRVWDVEQRMLLDERENFSYNTYVSLFPDSALFTARVSEDRAIVRDLSTGEHLYTLVHDGEHIFDFALSPDGSVLATSTWDGSLWFWRVSDGSLLRTIEAIDAHSDAVQEIVFSPDGRIVVTSGWDGTVRFWTVAEE